MLREELFKSGQVLLASLFVGAGGIFWLIYHWMFHKRNALLNVIPSPYLYPILGTVVELTRPNEEYFKIQFELREKYGGRFIIYTCGFYFVVLSNPEDVEKLLTSSVHIGKGFVYGLVKPWLGEGLLTSDGQKWHARRRLLTPSFHFRILEEFLVTFNEQAQILVEVLQQDFSDGRGRNICPYLSRCTLDIIGQTAMGRQLNSQRETENEYVKSVNMVCECLLYRVMRPYFWPTFIFNLTSSGRKFNAALKTLHDYTDMVIKEKKASRSSGANQEGALLTDVDEIYWHGKRRLAFLDSLLDAQGQVGEEELTDEDIREEVDTFMFEGHDTTSASLGWTIYLLGLHPNYQAKVHEELDQIFGEDKTRPMTSKDLVEMKYLEMCIKEALRLFPSVPAMSRKFSSDFVLDDKVTVPAGYDAIIMTMPIHRNPSIYPNPDEFLPDRFLPDNLRNRHPFAYIPFSAGPRNCIGQKFAMMEEKVILANVFRNFTVEAAEPMENITVMMEMVTRAKNGLKVCIRPR